MLFTKICISLLLIVCIIVTGDSFSLGDSFALTQKTQYVQIGVLDKITAHPQKINLTVGETFILPQLSILVEACYMNSPIETESHAAFFVIKGAHILPNKNNKHSSSTLFSGWMFSSSPSISSMDHPVFDAWLIKCFN